jgi:magnesium-transporting ATPase (P-type)
MNQQTGKYIIVAGLAIVVVGVLVYFLHYRLHWFGRLPGDIRVEKKNFRFYFPFTTMILISLLLTLNINIFKRL